MTRVFSTKMDAGLLERLDEFCHKHHMKKSSFLEEIIGEALERKEETLALVKSIERGLDEEAAGELYPADEVERSVFGKKRK